MTNRLLFFLLALPVFFTAFYVQGAFAENITLSSHGALLSEEKGQLRSDGFDLIADDTLVQLSPRHHGWLKFSLSLNEMEGDNVVFPDGSILPIDTSIESDLIFWMEDGDDQEDNGHVIRLSLSSDPAAFSHSIVCIDGRKVHLGAIRKKQARSDKDNLQLENLKLTAVIINISDESHSPASSEDRFSSPYAEYSDNGQDDPYSKKSPPPAYGDAQLPLFNQLDAIFETVGSTGSPWLIRGGGKIDSIVKRKLQLPLSKQLYLDSIIDYQTVHAERMVQVSMLFVPITPQPSDAATPANLEALEVIMNWLANEVASASEMYSIHRALLQTQGDFQGKETFVENYINKSGKLRAKKLLQSWKNRIGVGLPGEFKKILQRMRYRFPTEVRGAFDEIVPTLDMVQGTERVEYRPESKKVKTLSSHKKVVHQLKKEYQPSLPGIITMDSLNFYSTVQGEQQTVTGGGISISGLSSNIKVVQAVSDPSKAQPERRLGKNEKPEWPADDEKNQ